MGWGRRHHRSVLAATATAALALAGVLVLVTAGSSAASAPSLHWRDVDAVMSSPVVEHAEVAAVSCPSRSWCAMVLTSGATTPRPTHLASFNPGSDARPSIHGLPVGAGTFLSCPAPSTCVLAGSTIEVTTDDGARWTSEDADRGTTATSMQCATATHCIEAVETPGGASQLVIGDPLAGRWRHGALPGDAVRALAPSCTARGTCIFTSARLFEANLWAFESSDWGSSWHPVSLPGPERLESAGACGADGHCVVASADLHENAAGLDVQTGTAAFRQLSLLHAGYLFANDLIASPAVTCSSDRCVVAFGVGSAPFREQGFAYGDLANGVWSAYQVRDDPESNFQGSFTIDGACVVQWYDAVAGTPSVVRQGCPS
jgi:hypothetical protein